MIIKRIYILEWVLTALERYLNGIISRHLNGVKVNYTAVLYRLMVLRLYYITACLLTSLYQYYNDIRAAIAIISSVIT